MIMRYDDSQGSLLVIKRNGSGNDFVLSGSKSLLETISTQISVVISELKRIRFDIRKTVRTIVVTNRAPKLTKYRPILICNRT